MRYKYLLLIFSVTYSVNSLADNTLDNTFKSQLNNQAESQKSQKLINKLDDETRNALDEYRRNTAETSELEKYNNQLERLISSQKTVLGSIENQLAEIGITERQIVPLMLRMQNTLKEFIQLDTPFLKHERQLRIDALNDVMGRSDISLAEKYQRLIQAYQIEMDYGRTIESYQAILPGSSPVQTVDFLRIGRLGLYYLSLDGIYAGRWDSTTEQWLTLPKKYVDEIRNAHKVAAKQQAPHFLTLPFVKAEDTQ